MRRLKTILKRSFQVFAVLVLSHFFAEGVQRIEAYTAEQTAYALARTTEVIAQAGGYEKPVPPMPPMKALDLAEREAIRRALNPSLVRALMHVESTNNQYAVSKAGAIGYMQIMPFNAKRCGLKHYGELFDAEKNIRCGVQIAAENMNSAKDDVVKALRVYNGGSDCVKGGCAESENHWRLVLAKMVRDVR